MDDFAERERQVRDEVHRRDHFEDGQLRDWGQRMRPEAQRGRTGPGPFQIDVFQIILDELADARRAIDVGNDLKEKVRFRERGFHGCKIGGFVLVAHGAGRNADRAVIERAHHGIDLRAERGARKLFGKAPQLASAGNGRVVVEKHAMGVAALAALERNRNDLSAFRVVAEAGRVLHANELELHQRFAHLKRFRDQGAQLVRIGPVGDNQIFAVAEAIRPDRIGRAAQWHCERSCPYCIFVHG